MPLAFAYCCLLLIKIIRSSCFLNIKISSLLLHCVYRETGKLEDFTVCSLSCQHAILRFLRNSVCIQIDGSDKKLKKNSGGFQVGKRKVKTKLSALAKAKAEQAMEVDK